jgi:hypothetical protein
MVRSSFRLLLVALVMLVAPPTAVAQPAPDPALLARIEDHVQWIRRLPKKADVEVRFLDEASLRAYLIGSFERDYLPHERETDQKQLAILGLVRPSENLVDIVLDLLTEQVIGVYNADDKVMYVVLDEGMGPNEKVTFAHEFSHALQDQYYDLNAFAPKHTENNDRTMALHALIEGDAVLLQSLWTQVALSRDEMREMIAGGGDGGSALARAPAIIRGELLFPYLDGLSFVVQAYRLAGNDYSGVEELFRNPPESTAQILHPEKYRNRVHPIDVQVPDLPVILGEGWRKVGSNVMGELDTRLMLEQYGERAEAVRVAAGWAGDRWMLIERDGRQAMVMKSTWESEAAAQAFFSTYGRGLKARFPGAPSDEDSATRSALNAPDLVTDMRIKGREVQVVLSFDRASADQIVAALGA